MNRIEKIHRDTIIVDAHNDLPMHIAKKRANGQTKVIETQYLEDIKKGSVNVIVLAVFVEDQYLPESALREGLLQVIAVKQDIEESSNKIVLCQTYDDIMDAVNKNKLAVILSLEGVEPIQKNIELLRVFKELGVCITGISWSRRNFAADGCGFGKEETEIKGGLTAFGKQVVKYSEELGMIVDVTHLSEPAFWDTVKISNKPIIATHTDCQGVNNIKRNFTDEQIKAIAKVGGVIGMNGVSAIAVPKGKDNNLEILADHIDYIKNLVGIDHIGIGFDLYTYFMAEPNQIIIDDDGNETVLTDLVCGYKNLSKLTQILIDRGYTDDEISKFLGGNFIRMFKNL